MTVARYVECDRTVTRHAFLEPDGMTASTATWTDGACDTRHPIGPDDWPPAAVMPPLPRGWLIVVGHDTTVAQHFCSAACASAQLAGAQ